MSSDDEERLCLQRPWSDLPEIILHAIAVSLPGPADFFAFAGVCRAWRSSSYFSAKEFLSSLPPLLFCTSLIPVSNNPSSSSSTSLFLYSLRNDDAVYQFPSSAIASGLLFIGQSNGHLIALDKATKSIPSIINPFTGAQTVFPAIIRPFQYAILTEADTAHPDCRLVLIDEVTSRICYCLVSGRQWQRLYFWPKGLTDAISYKGRLYFVQHHNKVLEFDYLDDIFHEVAVEAPFGGRLVESTDGDLLMLQTGPPPVQCWRVLPAPVENVNLDGYPYDLDCSWERVFVWPARRTLMLRWQRSDVMGSPWLGRMPRREKIVDVDRQASFWRNYLELSPPCSNGVYVIVDDRGRPTLATYVPRTGIA